jgi:hypothetical protein
MLTIEHMFVEGVLSLFAVAGATVTLLSEISTLY